MTPRRLTGCGTALVTPFSRDGALDERALRALVDWQIEQGIHFLVPCGSTGEAATLSMTEQRRVVELVVEQAAGRVPVVAGAGANETRRAVELSREMQAAGATHLLHTSPWYNKPPQRGIVEHYRAVSDATDLPIVVYNVPGRTASNIEPRTLLEIAGLPNVAAVKEASGNLVQIADVIRDRPPHLSVLSGDDALTLAVLSLGGDGVISVTSNATPRLMAEMCDAAHSGNFASARQAHERLLPWMHAAFVESNPIPVKAAMAMLGRIENALRLPLVPLADAHVALVRTSLESAGALPAGRSG